MEAEKKKTWKSVLYILLYIIKASYEQRKKDILASST